MDRNISSLLVKIAENKKKKKKRKKKEKERERIKLERYYNKLQCDFFVFFGFFSGDFLLICLTKS